MLGLLVHTFVPTGPVILGLDDTIERRRGKHITAKGIYRDPVRSSDAHFVKGLGPALAQPHAPGAHPVGRPHLGSASPHCPGALRAVLP